MLLPISTNALLNTTLPQCTDLPYAVRGSVGTISKLEAGATNWLNAASAAPVILYDNLQTLISNHNSQEALKEHTHPLR
jgi:hypothetical protein